MLYMLLDL